MKNNGFYVRADQLKVLSLVLSDYDHGEVLVALADYCVSGKMPEKSKMTDATYLAFQFLRLEIDLENGGEALGDEDEGHLD